MAKHTVVLVMEFESDDTTGTVTDLQIRESDGKRISQALRASMPLVNYGIAQEDVQVLSERNQLYTARLGLNLKHDLLPPQASVKLTVRLNQTTAEALGRE